MNKASKKIMALVAVVALVAVLGICLVACNSDSVGKSLEKKGYTVTKLNEDSTGLGKTVYDLVKNNSAFEEGVFAAKDSDTVVVLWYNNADEAEKAANSLKYVAKKVECSGKIVYAGTEQGVKDAK